MALTFTDLLLYGKILGGGVPASVANAAGDVSAMIKHIVEEVAKISGTTDISPTADPNGSMAERLAYLQQLTPLGAGIVKNARDWAGGAGFVFLFDCVGDDHPDMPTATSNIGGLTGWGWAQSGVINDTPNTGDLFVATSDIGPNGSAGMVSPRIFGGADHRAMAAKFLSVTPTKLVLEFYGRWAAAASNNETTSWICGFTRTTSDTDASAAGSAGCITSNGTNFVLTSDNGSDVGAALDTNHHWFRIEIGAATTEWFIDDVSQGTIATETGIFPVAVSIRRSTGNQPRLSQGRVYYAA